MEVPGYFNQDMRMSLFFEQDKLAYFTGDLVPGAANPEATEEAEPATADS